ncbi:hypothetical protein OsJ_22230 [Oryza sativa Japonica Group]|uniref:Uncharacterized protein n=1 Tax=Oryza sativa subsp. japonica TaxID=39947 RepID=B9FQB9_ORYSJ|nr:hypothetical protein OsJ_22230 [Oryza sativa Japonica Group]
MGLPKWAQRQDDETDCGPCRRGLLVTAQSKANPPTSRTKQRKRVPLRFLPPARPPAAASARRRRGHMLPRLRVLLPGTRGLSTASPAEAAPAPLSAAELELLFRRDHYSASTRRFHSFLPLLSHPSLLLSSALLLRRRAQPLAPFPTTRAPSSRSRGGRRRRSDLLPILHLRLLLPSRVKGRPLPVPTLPLRLATLSAASALDAVFAPRAATFAYRARHAAVRYLRSIPNASWHIQILAVDYSSIMLKLLVQLVDSVIDLARNLVIPTELIVMAGIGFHEMDDKATGPCRRWNIFGGVRSTAAVDTSYAQDLDQSLKGRQIATARSGLHYAIVYHKRGILDLHQDVQTCGYEDVQVMWNMLSSEKEAAPPPPRKRALWRLRLPVWPAAVWSPRGRGMQQREPNPTADCNFAM